MRNSRFAQSAVELALFGAILVFVIGSIARSGLATTLAMNLQIKTMRMAFAESYRTALGTYTSGTPSAARNTASILVVEDRLSVAAGTKHSSTDRFPIGAQSRATMSHTLFLSFDYGENQALPLVDFYVNGQRFPLTTARYKAVRLSDPAIAGGRPAWITRNCDTGQVPPGGSICWDSECLVAQTNPVCSTVTDADGNSVTTCTCTEEPAGCAIMFNVVGNYSKSKNWCSSDPCSSNMSAADRFDLDFDGLPEVPASAGPTGPEVHRGNFMWQWYKVAGAKPSYPSSWAGYGYYVTCPPIAFAADTRAATVNIDKDKSKNNRNTQLDVDGDYKEEYVLSYSKTDDAGRLRWIYVLDSQDGDLDFTADNRDAGQWSQAEILDPPTAGCLARPLPLATDTCAITNPPTTQDAQNYSGGCSRWACQARKVGLDTGVARTYSFTRFNRDNMRKGTYLRIQEGKLFNPTTDEYVRDTRMTDHVDILERSIQLSNNTRRFCHDGTVTDWAAVLDADALKVTDDMGEKLFRLGAVSGLTNPVEACNNCFSGDNVEKTCMEETSNIIFVRSRISDLRGRRWVRARRYVP